MEISLIKFADESGALGPAGLAGVRGAGALGPPGARGRENLRGPRPRPPAPARNFGIGPRAPRPREKF